MPRTITALFDTRVDAEAGRQRLLEADLHADHVRIHDKTSIGEAGYSSDRQPGMWASIKNAFLPDEDRHIYEEGVRRGGFLLTADVEESQINGAVQALDDVHLQGVDIDERASQWKSQGWQPPAPGLDTASAATGSSASQNLSAQHIGANEARFNVIEEQLIVGRREVDRGGVRVRSYVTETPVHEQIRLRNERISVERRPVDQVIDDVGSAFKERTFEVIEAGEEAVVSKNARVVQEVMIKKTSDKRVEVINETVRRTDVDVQKIDSENVNKSRD